MSNRSSSTKKSQVVPVSPRTGIASASSQSTGLARGFDNIFDDFRNSFNEMIAPFTPLTTLPGSMNELPTRYAFVDLVDNGDGYLVTAELPGFNKDDVDVQVNKEGLLIRAETKNQNEQKGKNYIHRERAYSSFERVIGFPEEVNPSKVEGQMKDGILEIRIPKREAKPEERLTKVSLR